MNTSPFNPHATQRAKDSTTLVAIIGVGSEEVTCNCTRQREQGNEASVAGGIKPGRSFAPHTGHAIITTIFYLLMCCLQTGIALRPTLMDYPQDVLNKIHARFSVSERALVFAHRFRHSCRRYFYDSDRVASGLERSERRSNLQLIRAVRRSNHCSS